MDENSVPDGYTIQRILNIFASSATRNTIIGAEKAGIIPVAGRRDAGSVRVRAWNADDVPKIGARYGFLKPFSRPLVLTVFTTKGGSLKTTLALNIARLAALHDIRTCVVGLDIQGDITTAMGYEVEVDDTESIEAALDRLNSTKGLGDVYEGRAKLEETVLTTDLPTLSLLPETPELAALDDALSGVGELRREYWLTENVVNPLKQRFDLIVLDCSPNWNMLVTNALVASDVLVSPLECKINNFRNLKVFRGFVERFRRKLHLDFAHIFVPTRLTSTRKLSTAIRAWYMQNLPNCTNTSIRENSQGEESISAHLSVPEYAPKSLFADEMRELLTEVWAQAHTKAAAVSAKTAA